MQNTIFWAPFCPNLGKNDFSTQNWATILFSNYKFMQKIRKKEPSLRKLLTNKQTNTGEVIGCTQYNW